MVEDIQSIKHADVTHLQDILLLIFWKSVRDYVSELFGLPVGEDDDSPVMKVVGGGEDDDSPVMKGTGSGELPAKLAAAGEELLAALAAMKEAYRKVDFKELSAEIRKRDKERDSLLRGVKSLVKTMARFSSMPEQQAAAQYHVQAVPIPRTFLQRPTALAGEWSHVAEPVACHHLFIE